jgi:hypothetical protein
MVAPPPPSANDAPPAPPPPGDDATPPATAAPPLRVLVARVLKSDSDLDAFCIDHFKDVHDRFTNGMDRVEKVNQLLSHADHGEIRRRLPAAEIRIARRRRLKGGALALVALGVGAGGGIIADRLHERPPVMAPDTSIPSFEPFAAQAPGVVLGGPWMTEHGQDLHQALFDLDPQHAVRSVPFTRFASVTAFHEKARAAGAVVIVDVGEDGMAHVQPFGALEKNTLLRAPLTISLVPEATRARTAIVINALARLGGARPDLQADTVVCPDLGPPQLDHVALLTLLVVPQCRSIPVASSRFEGLCAPSPQPVDEVCALALYLDGQHNPGVARKGLERLRSSGLARFELLARVELAYLDCSEEGAEGAQIAVQELSDRQLGAPHPDPCILAELAETAACLVTRVGKDRVAPRMVELEASPIDPDKRCPERQRARSMARRGYWRGLGGRWDGARADYEEAYGLSKDPARGLDLVEAWLWLRQPDQATKRLEPLRGVGDRAQQVTGALLGWLVARQTRNAAERKAAEAALSALHGAAGGAAALPGAKAESLQQLTCGADQAASPDCLYNVLRRISSNEELQASFRARYDGGAQGKSR